MQDISPDFTLPYSRYVSFQHEWIANEEWQKHLRYGQALYNYLDLHKMNQTPFLDKLYNELDINKVLIYTNKIMDYEN